jgi:very-short-patch-repair endonuclease
LIVPYDSHLKEISRQLRCNPTPAEKCLWKKLRLKHLGVIFHRQKPIGGYIVDFYCPEVKLVIEVDGDYHTGIRASSNDRIRDDVLRGLSITVLRFLNSEVMNNTDHVIEKIKQGLLTAPKKQ